MKARIEFNVTLWLLALVGKGLLAFAPPPLAFGTRKCGGRGGLYTTTTPADGGRDASSTFCRQHCILYSTPSKDDDDDDVSESETTVLTKEKLMSEARVTPPAVPTTEPKEKEDNTQQQLPPIDLPSPLLLGTSMVLAIAGTGKLFLTFLHVWKDDFCLDFCSFLLLHT
jgi:hypothetical protein